MNHFIIPTPEPNIVGHSDRLCPIADGLTIGKSTRDFTTSYTTYIRSRVETGYGGYLSDLTYLVQVNTCVGRQYNLSVSASYSGDPYDCDCSVYISIANGNGGVNVYLNTNNGQGLASLSEVYTHTEPCPKVIGLRATTAWYGSQGPQSGIITLSYSITLL